jgi:hypothetical protein
MKSVDDDRDGAAAARGLGGDGLDLRVVAVGQDDPSAAPYPATAERGKFLLGS